MREPTGKSRLLNTAIRSVYANMRLGFQFSRSEEYVMVIP